MRTKITLSTPPADSLSDDFTSCSEWCHKMWTECIERGDEESAGHYMELYNQWLSRGY